MQQKVILVAEDSAEEIFLLKRSFLAAGINADLRFVRDGQEAIDYFEGTNGFEDRKIHPLPRLVLLDLKMPKLDGFDVLKWMRKHPEFRCTVTVVLTSSDEPRDVRKAYELQANSYIRKPFDRPAKELAELLYRYWMEVNLCAG